jgi:hypothetical protein
VVTSNVDHRCYRQHGLRSMRRQTQCQFQSVSPPRKHFSTFLLFRSPQTSRFNWKRRFSFSSCRQGEPQSSNRLCPAPFGLTPMVATFNVVVECQNVEQILKISNLSDSSWQPPVSARCPPQMLCRWEPSMYVVTS